MDHLTKEFYTVKELADMIGAEVALVYGDLKSGRLKGARNLSPYPPSKQDDGRRWPITIPRAAAQRYFRLAEKMPITIVHPSDLKTDSALRSPLRGITVTAFAHYLATLPEVEREEEGFKILLELLGQKNKGEATEIRAELKRHLEMDKPERLPKEESAPVERVYIGESKNGQAKRHRA